jgi:hypothetical protein
VPKVDFFLVSCYYFYQILKFKVADSTPHKSKWIGGAPPEIMKPFTLRKLINIPENPHSELENETHSALDNPIME